MNGSLESNIVLIANAYLGNKARKNNLSFESLDFQQKMFNVGWRSGLDWCAFFVKLVWEDACKKTNPSNLVDLLSKVGQLGGNSNDNWNIAKRIGLTVSGTPKRGSIVVYTYAKNNNLLSSGHTAIVYDFNANGIYTIDGNTTQNAEKSGSRVVEKKYRAYSVFGRPYIENKNIASTGRKMYIRGFIYPPEAIDTNDSVSKINVLPKESEILNADVTKKDVYYIFSRDAGILRDKSGIGDNEGLIIKFSKDFSYNDFLNYKGEGSFTRTNKQIIESQRITIEEGDDFDKDLIKAGTVISLPFSAIVRDDTDIDPSKTDSNNYDEASYISFKEMLRGMSYGFTNPSEIFEMSTSVSTSQNYFSIWIYSKSLNKIIDVTRYCDELDINSIKHAGDFNLNLCDIGTKETKKSDNVFYTNISNEISFLANHINTNDIVFIQLNNVAEYEVKQLSTVPFEELANKNYTTIGLVDVCSEIKMATNTEISISVSGRDLSKLFEDDEALFFPLALTQNANGQMIIGTSESGSNLLKRNFITGHFDILFGKISQSIGTIFSFYIKMLQNIGYVPESNNDVIFSSYIGEDGTDRRRYIDESKDQLAKGVYQIIGLNVEEAVSIRRVVDTNVGNPKGPFMNLFEKICQEPFVEFLLDTYKDKYEIIVRQPPFTKKAIQEVVNDNLYFTINDNKITDKSFQFNTDIYTWFQLEVQGLFFGGSNEVALSYCPVIQLDEYVNLWGSKRFSVIHNYRNTSMLNDSETVKTYNEFRKQATDDLAYLVEIYSYMPFVRVGKITLGYIDSRLKKGTFVRLNDELFYIDSVQHSAMRRVDSVDGTTTLTLSRGMMIKNIIGENTYFDIVNIDLLKKVLNSQWYVNKVPNNSNVSGTIINKEVFNFYLQKSHL